ncbi:hypothetical protein ABW11_21110 [Pluralibacter gergoviae]|nr:hypothetical protein ABW11_21110 [Pluralibacter gergoviae]
MRAYKLKKKTLNGGPSRVKELIFHESLVCINQRRKMRNSSFLLDLCMGCETTIAGIAEIASPAFAKAVSIGRQSPKARMR